MKLTIEQLSKLTKLSIPTLRVYVSRQKLGTKSGNKRLYSQTDVQKLLKASKKPSLKKRIVPSKKKASTGRKGIKAASIKADVTRAKPQSLVPVGPIVKTTKPSFWTRLFGGRKPKQKISLLDAKMTK